eukprot:6143594-Amphidinium_carterae.1
MSWKNDGHDSGLKHLVASLPEPLFPLLEPDDKSDGCLFHGSFHNFAIQTAVSCSVLENAAK